MGIKFNESELKVVEISHAFRNSNIPVFDYPVSRKEGWKSMADRKPHWLPTGVEFFNFYPDIIPDNRARGFVNDGGITLTESGLQVAQTMYTRHTVLSQMLMKLGVDEKTAAEDACKAEHILSEQTLEKIRERALLTDAESTCAARNE